MSSLTQTVAADIPKISRFQSLRQLLQLLWAFQQRDLIILILIIIFNGIIPIIQIDVIRRLIDSVILLVRQAATIQDVLIHLGIVIAVGFFMAVIPALGDLHQLNMQDRLQTNLQEQLLLKAGSLSLSAFERSEFFDRLHRAQRGLDERLLETMRAFFNLPIIVVRVIGILVYVGAVNLLFPVIILVGLLPPVGVYMYNGSRRWQMAHRHAEEERRLNYLEDLITSREAAAEIRLFGLNNYLEDSYRKKADLLRNERLTIAWRELLSHTISDLSVPLTLMVLIILVLFMIYEGTLSLGYFAAYISTTLSFNSVLWSGARIGSAFASDLRYIQDIFEYLQLSSDQDSTHKRSIKQEQSIDSIISDWDTNLQPTIRFESIGFSYSDNKQPVLCDITFTLNPGERIALVGENGAGKTTLTKILLKLYEPTSGRITINGKDLAQVDPLWWRKQVAVVFQDFVKYELSVIENIGFGDIDKLSALQSVKDAAVRSGVDNAIEDLPQKYNTILGKTYDDKGHDFSIGQWQKIAIARAYFRDANLLILDEPTAALDAKAEVEVYRQFNEMSMNKSVLLISHRLGSARLADRILVLEDGRIVEQGNHTELIAHGGRYAEMYKTQAAWYE